jgi:hypothetical protein
VIVQEMTGKILPQLSCAGVEGSAPSGPFFRPSASVDTIFPSVIGDYDNLMNLGEVILGNSRSFQRTDAMLGFSSKSSKH